MSTSDTTSGAVTVTESVCLQTFENVTTVFSVSPCGVIYFHRQGTATRQKGPMS